MKFFATIFILVITSLPTFASTCNPPMIADEIQTIKRNIEIGLDREIGELQIQAYENLRRQICGEATLLDQACSEESTLVLRRIKYVEEDPSLDDNIKSLVLSAQDNTMRQIKATPGCK